MTTRIISNEEKQDIIKIVKHLEEPCLLNKGVSKTIDNEAKEPKSGLIVMLSGPLDASFMGVMVSGKNI